VIGIHTKVAAAAMEALAQELRRDIEGGLRHTESLLLPDHLDDFNPILGTRSPLAITAAAAARSIPTT
jgi:hypothetical protein